jgi:hypothetical protein
VAGAGWPNSGSSPRVLAGEGYGGDLGTLGASFGRSAGAVVAPASGAPAASECGRRGCCSRRAGRAWSW